MGTAEEVLGSADGGESLLDRDDVPNANQSVTCFSCDAPMVGLYCHACGNKNDDYRRSIFRLIVEMFTNVTALDSRVWRTLWTLMRKPGQVARDYADGARTRWTSPVRLFLAASLLLFGYISLSGTQMIAFGNLQGEEPEVASLDERYPVKLHWFVQRDRLVFPPDGAKIVLSGQQLGAAGVGFNAGYRDAVLNSIEDIEEELEGLSEPSERAVLETQLERLRRELDEIADDKPVDDLTGSETSNDVPATFGTGRDRSVTLDADGTNQLMQRVLRNPQVVNNQLNTKLKWMMFLMLPLTMLLGAVFIRGRDKAMLYDHLVHAGYIHAFSFLLLLVFILLAQFTPIPFLVLIYTGILLVYLPMSAKGMFRRSDIKSILTAYGVGIVYSTIMMIAAISIIARALAEEAATIEASKPAVEAPADAPVSEPEPEPGAPEPEPQQP